VATRPPARVCVAQVGAAHGIRGEVRLRAFTDDPMAIAGYSPLETEDGSRSLVIEAVRPARDALVARIAGVRDRDAAGRLKNIRLYVPRARLPQLADADDFYHADLIGLAVVDPAGETLGTVAAVQNFGAGDLLEVVPAAGGPTVLLPFTKAVVPQIDLANSRLVVDPPEGAFAAAAAPDPERRRGRRGRGGDDGGAGVPESKA
jgi:16S rRNA processing protein RimM